MNIDLKLTCNTCHFSICDYNDIFCNNGQIFCVNCDSSALSAYTVNEHVLNFSGSRKRENVEFRFKTFYLHLLTYTPVLGITNYKLKTFIIAMQDLSSIGNIYNGPHVNLNCDFVTLST